MSDSSPSSSRSNPNGNGINNHSNDSNTSANSYFNSRERPVHPLSASHEEDSFNSMGSTIDVDESLQLETNGKNGNVEPSSSGGGDDLRMPTAVTNGNGNGIGNRIETDSMMETNGIGNGRRPLEDLDESKFKPMFEGSSIDRREFIRLTLQSLKDLGYQQTASSLELESGLQLESPSITSFRQSVLSGDWKNAEKHLLQGFKEVRSRLMNRTEEDYQFPSQSKISGRGSGRMIESVGKELEWELVLKEPGSKGLDWIKFLLHQQRYLELLESRQTKKALEVLRKRLAPLAINFGTDRLHQLSSLVMCATSEELKSRAGWDGSHGNSRRDLLYEIEGAVSPQVMIPSRRLPQLLEQAQNHQKDLDPFYNQVSDQPLSLYTDHVSSRSVFPTYNGKQDVLIGHEDEVWNLQWNHKGDSLASCGKDGWIIIWKFSDEPVKSRNDENEDEEMESEKRNGKKRKEDDGDDEDIEMENGQQNESGNGNGILEGEEREGKEGLDNRNASSDLWNPSSSISEIKLFKKLGPHSGSITWLAWSPDDSQILAASDTVILLWNVEKESSKTFKGHTYTVGTVAWMPDGKSFVTGGMDGKVNIWSLDGKAIQTILTYPFRIKTLAVSPDSKNLIILSWRATPPAPPGSTASNSATTTHDSRNGHQNLSGNDGRNSSMRGVGLAEGDNLAGGSREMGNHRQQLHFYDLVKKQERGSIFFSEQMQTVTISNDSRFALINQRPNETQLWDIESRTALARYVGHKVEHDVIGNCFGGILESFVVTGSEDSCIYVYHRASGKLIEKLSGHEEGSVNAVAWHPTRPALFASCGDDQTVRIWRPASNSNPKVILSPLRISNPKQISKSTSTSPGGLHGSSRNHRGNAYESGESSSNGHGGSMNPFPWSSSPLHRGGATSPSPVHSPIVQILAASPPVGITDDDDEDQDDDDVEDEEEEEDEDDEDENMEEDEEAL